MPLDTRIALGVQPLQVQFRDLGADYNQLSQMRSAENQNQLAQMQMQESRQLAPLRMQEQQSRATVAKMALDEVNEAQTYVKSVMTEAANKSGGTAPKDPFAVAKQMIDHPNAQVQAAGLRLLESSQKLIAFENQRANEAAYEADQRGAGAPAAAPTVASDLSKFVAGTKTTPEGDVAPYFSIAGQPASEEEYTRQKEAIMLPPPVNAMAGTAGNVNAMVKPISPLQDPAALLEEIKKGDQQFARGGTPAPGWKNKRELLVKAFEQALKPGRGDGERYLGLGAGRALDKFTGQVISADKIPAAAAGPRIFYVRGAPHTLNEEGNLEPLTVEGGVSSTVAVQPQAVSAPKITTVKGAPYTFNFETGRLEAVPIEGGGPAVVKGGVAKPVPSSAGRPKPPSGYRYDASGENLEPIPGGPASEKLQPKEIQKREAALPQAKQAVKTVSNTMSVIGQTVDSLLANPEGIDGITGLIYGVTPAITGPARKAKAELEQLKNLAFIQGITELRAASKTGAAVGNVTNREGDRFENLKASLDRSQSKDDLIAALKKLKQQADLTTQFMTEAFDDTYSYKSAAPVAGQGTGGFKYLGKE